MNLEVKVVLLARFPSTKAYGVNTSHTLSAIRELGNGVEILSPTTLVESEYIGKSIKSILRFLIFYYTKNFYFSKIAFLLNSFFFLFLVKRLSKKWASETIVWSRSFLAVIMLPKRFRYFVEIHRISRGLKALRFLQRRRSIKLGAISLPLLDWLEKNLSKLSRIYCPMAIPESFLFTPSRKEEFVLGYFGSMKSSGQDQGVLTLLRQICSLSNEQFDGQIILGGIGKSGVEECSQVILKSKWKNRVTLIDHILHDEIPAYLSRCSALVLPFRSTEYHRVSYPIKALEYASSRKPIIAGETEDIVNIFGHNSVWYYDGSIESFLSAFQQIKDNNDIFSSKLEAAFNMARDNTYLLRTKRILEAINSIRF
jgi:glycosyltransferase involved in cell wall biosynthesis